MIRIVKRGRKRNTYVCPADHEFKATAYKAQKSKCPRCKIYKGEHTTRLIFEEIYKQPFPNQRPTWLCGLELDGYCEPLGIAFEFQGEQHYKYIRKFHKSKKAFMVQLQNDAKKVQLCKDIKLYIIDSRLPILPQIDPTLDLDIEILIQQVDVAIAAQKVSNKSLKVEK